MIRLSSTRYSTAADVVCNTAILAAIAIGLCAIPIYAAVERLASIAA